MSRMKKVPVEKITGREDRRGIREYRKETNDEIMHKSVLKRGFIRLNVQIRMLHPDTSTYAGWHGGALMIEAETVAKAKQFTERHRTLVLKLCEELGLAMPNVIVVKK